ncbi:MAG TPA: protein translocase subunit SecD [Dehalococcoidia bacterium]|nr:protein translocase subunit SecD [Dehalococcoidia bacterium]
MRNNTNRAMLAFVVALFVVAVYIIWPNDPKKYLPGFVPWPSGSGLHLSGFKREQMRLGLDLKGGARTVVQAQLPSGYDTKNLPAAMDEAVKIYENRVNKFGLSEAEVTKQGNDKIAVDVPGITADEERNLIGKTAQLEFKEPQIDPTTSAPKTDANGQPLFTPACLDYGCPNGEQPLTGKLLKPNSYVSQDAAGQPEVAFNFTSEGGKIFGAVTGRNIGKQIAIYLDEDQISAPTVQAQISDSGVITGLTANSAKQLVAQLNSGALPLNFNVVQQTTVDATLGKDSVSKTVFAGEIGFLAVAFFMIVFYRLPGVLATLALIVYTAVVLMIFKLVPVTLTLPGIAAFVLSIGIAVDANILIFERTKEELRAGRGLNSAIEQGFRRAWPSIRDSNVSTIITSLILFYFGDQFGAALVKGFALNLAIGVVISLFSSILVTRLFLLLTVGTRLGRSKWMFGAQRPQYAARAEELQRREPRRLPGFLNLVGNRKYYYALSIAIMVPGLISLAAPGERLRPGIEFTSGTTFTLRFQQPPSQAQLAQQLASYGFGDPALAPKGNDEWTVSFPGGFSADQLQQKLRADFSVDKFAPSADGGDLKLKTPPSQEELRKFVQSPPDTVPAVVRTAAKDARVQGASSDEFLVRTKEIPGNVTSSDVGPAQPTALDSLRNAMIAQFGHLTDTNNRVTDRLIDSNTVSSIVSKQIVKQAALAVIVASLFILIYITWAFRAVRNPFRYGLSAIIALMHDVLVVVGLFSIFGRLFNTEIDTMFITGLLTVIGFSVHDTIVVFDRIRENLQRGISRDFEVTVNESLLQTLDRSLSTSLTVVFTLVALLLLGGTTIQAFVLVLLIGIISGTYSSIAIASQILVEWHYHDPTPGITRFLNRLGIRRRRRAPTPVRPGPRQPVV